MIPHLFTRFHLADLFTLLPLALRRFGVVGVVRRLPAYLLGKGWKRYMRLNRTLMAGLDAATVEDGPSEHGTRNGRPGARELFARPHVLIVGSLDLPQCRKYRVFQKLEMLKGLGVACTAADYLDLQRALAYLPISTCVMFYRVPDGEHLRYLLDECRRLGVSTVYDIDDPIFDRQVYEENENLQSLSHKEREGLLDSSGLYASALGSAARVTVSTPGMEALARRHTDAPVSVWRNALDSESLSIARDILADEGETRRDEAVNICYMSGSRAHDADFASILPALVGVMDAWPEVNLILGGYVGAPDELRGYGERVRRQPFGGYRGYFKVLSGADINLVPLKIDRFNECKSAIRFLEAAVVGVPTVAAAVGDFRNLIEEGRTGFLVDEISRWSDVLGRLVSERDLRTRTGRAASAAVLESATAEAIASSLEPALLAHMGRRNG